MLKSTHSTGNGEAEPAEFSECCFPACCFDDVRNHTRTHLELNLPQRPFLFLPLGCPRKKLNGVSSSKNSGSRTVDPATLAAKPDDEALVEALADEAPPAALAAKPDDEALAEALADEVPQQLSPPSWMMKR